MMSDNFKINSKFSNLNAFGTKLIEFQTSTKFFYCRCNSKFLSSINLIEPYNKEAIFYEAKYKCLKAGYTTSKNSGYM